MIVKKTYVSVIHWWTTATTYPNGHFQLNGSLWWWCIWKEKNEYSIKQTLTKNDFLGINTGYCWNKNTPHENWQLECISTQVGGKIFDQARHKLWPYDELWQHFQKENIQNARNFLKKSIGVFIDCFRCSVFESWKFQIVFFWANWLFYQFNWFINETEMNYFCQWSSRWFRWIWTVYFVAIPSQRNRCPSQSMC